MYSFEVIDHTFLFSNYMFYNGTFYIYMLVTLLRLFIWIIVLFFSLKRYIEVLYPVGELKQNDI